MTNNEQIIEIPIEKIKPNPNQPRKKIDEEKLKELAESIKASGLIVPIQVIKKKDYWELVAGERRWRAHKIAKLKTIKAIEKVYSKDSSRKIDSLLENLHREDLNEFEKATTLQLVKDDDKLTIMQLAEKVGLGDSTVRNLLNLLDPAIEHLAEAVKKGEIIEHHARTVRTIKNKEMEKKVLNIIKVKELSVTKTEELVRTLKNVPQEVKEAVLSDDISVEQADRISKISSEEGRRKAIQEHKTIKMVDKGVERNITNQMSSKEKRAFEKKLLQAKQVIMSFRNSVTDSYSAIEKTLKIIVTVLPHISYMDGKEKHKLNIELGRLLEILERGSQLTEQIKEKIDG
jgi:ParB family chromosome partitioning protein